LHPNSRDIFATLCENLIQSVIKLNTEQKISRTVVNQLEKWKTLFEKNNSTGLTPAEQQGLYGELHFLQKFLAKQEAVFRPHSLMQEFSCKQAQFQTCSGYAERSRKSTKLNSAVVFQLTSLRSVRYSQRACRLVFPAITNYFSNC
jgi:hypothetical protein